VPKNGAVPSGDFRLPDDIRTPPRPQEIGFSAAPDQPGADPLRKRLRRGAPCGRFPPASTGCC